VDESRARRRFNACGRRCLDARCYIDDVELVLAIDERDARSLGRRENEGRGGLRAAPQAWPIVELRFIAGRRIR
jgi:hypothetical protein